MLAPRKVKFAATKKWEDTYNTNQPERLQSLYSVLDAVKVCPVAFEIYEQLKKEYDFFIVRQK